MWFFGFKSPGTSLFQPQRDCFVLSIWHIVIYCKIVEPLLCSLVDSDDLRPTCDNSWAFILLCRLRPPRAHMWWPQTKSTLYTATSLNFASFLYHRDKHLQIMPKKKKTGPGKGTTGRPKNHDSDSETDEEERIRRREAEKQRIRDAVAKLRDQVIVDNFVFRNLFSCHQESPAKIGQPNFCNLIWRQ